MLHIKQFASRHSFLEFLQHAPEFQEQRQYEHALAERHRDEELYHLMGYCKVCAKPTEFQVDRVSSYLTTDSGAVLPNWRERLLCQPCQINNRQRAILHQIHDFVTNHPTPAAAVRVYAMEQVTPLYQKLVDMLPNSECVGSEYINAEYASGTVVNGVRHEDVEALSFADNYFDVISSNDVLEHVNQPQQAMREVWRVLKPGGALFLTIPFYAESDHTVRRAEIVDGKLVHYHEPVYHGNPLSAEGSLVFNDLGWDFLQDMRDIGFAEVNLCLYWSCVYGYLGAPLFYFYAQKPHE